MPFTSNKRSSHYYKSCRGSPVSPRRHTSDYKYGSSHNYIDSREHRNYDGSSSAYLKGSSNHSHDHQRNSSYSDNKCSSSKANTPLQPPRASSTRHNLNKSPPASSQYYHLETKWFGKPKITSAYSKELGELKKEADKLIAEEIEIGSALSKVTFDISVLDQDIENYINEQRALSERLSELDKSLSHQN